MDDRTPATEALAGTDLAFRVVRIRPAGGPEESAERQGIALGALIRTLGVRRAAHAVTGYERGAITPFGARRDWPVLMDAAALEHETVAIGGGVRGVNLHLAPRDLAAQLRAEIVDVSEPDRE